MQGRERKGIALKNLEKKKKLIPCGRGGCTQSQRKKRDNPAPTQGRREGREGFFLGRR